MKTIKASEILKMNPTLTLDILKGYKYYAVDSEDIVSIYRREPYTASIFWVGSPWLDLCDVEDASNWKDSLREIDFTTDEELIEIEVKGSKFNLTIWEIACLKAELTEILCNNDTHVESVKNYLEEFEKSDKEFPDEIFTPKSQQ